MIVTVAEAHRISRRVGALIYWRPDNTKTNPKDPDSDSATVLNMGLDIPYKRGL